MRLLSLVAIQICGLEILTISFDPKDVLQKSSTKGHLTSTHIRLTACCCHGSGCSTATVSALILSFQTLKNLIPEPERLLLLLLTSHIRKSPMPVADVVGYQFAICLSKLSGRLAGKKRSCRLENLQSLRVHPVDTTTNTRKYKLEMRLSIDFTVEPEKKSHANFMNQTRPCVFLLLLLSTNQRLAVCMP